MDRWASWAVVTAKKKYHIGQNDQDGETLDKYHFSNWKEKPLKTDKSKNLYTFKSQNFVLIGRV